jgi:hypothetical protein
MESSMELHLLRWLPTADHRQVQWKGMRNKTMRIILSFVALSSVFSMLAMAETYNGKLLDATCYDQQKKAAACDATSSTSTFALEVGGAVHRLDRVGNTKAAAALKNRADRSDPSQPQSKEVMAKVDGTEKGGTITVENIEVQ